MFCIITYFNRNDPSTLTKTNHMLSSNEDNNVNLVNIDNNDQHHLNHAELESKKASAVSKSRFYANKTSRVHNEIKFSANIMQDLKHTDVDKNEQAGSIEPQLRRNSQLSNVRDAKKHNHNGPTETGDVLFSRSNNSMKSIHNLHEEKRQKLISKYSKESLMKSVKQTKMGPNKETPQKSDPYLVKVNICSYAL